MSSTRVVTARHERIHRAVSDDGTEVAGRVHGQGPALVLVHGSFGQPVRLVGESMGGALALGAAARTDAVSAVAGWEPVVFTAMRPELYARGRAVTQYLPLDIEEIRGDLQAVASDRAGPLGSSVLADISAPVLFLRGARSALRGWFADAADHVAEHVADARVREIPDAAHFGVVTTPRAIADELVAFHEGRPGAGLRGES